jgi:hypothetical protein
MGLPTKKALPVFLYSKDAKVIDVVPKSTAATYNVGEIISYDSSETGTGGYYQGTEISVLVGDKHDPTYTDAASLALLGIQVLKYPQNFFLYTDQDGDLDISDYTLREGSFAGSLDRMPVLVESGIVLVDFWDSTAGGQAAEALVGTDMFAVVYASQTAGGDTGLAGKASLARSNPNASGNVAIGRLVGIPIVGGRYGYVMFDPYNAR